MPAGNLAWLLTSLLLAGVPAHHKLAVTAANELELRQEAGGRWPGDGMPGSEVHTTLESLRALRACGRWAPAG